MKRPVRSSTSCLALLFVLFPVTSTPDDKLPGWDELVSVYYRLEVTNYCAITTQTALLGFEIVRDELMQQYDFTQQQVDSIRAEAWTAGYREWDNRGLGGFRGWCKKEGVEYLEYFNSIAGKSNSGS